jgi:2-dehydropantoate 2-reductase
MDVLVIGAGGVGGYFGAKLALAGHAVTFLARGSHADAIARDGLKLTGFESRTAPAAVLRPGDLGPGPWELIVLAVKSQDLPELLPRLAPDLPANATLVTLQNGVDAEEMCLSIVPRERLVAGVAYIDASLADVGVIEVAGPGRLAFGLLSGGARGRLDAVAKLFAASGVGVTVSDDLQKTKWNKLCWNAVFNPLCLLTRLTVGEVRSNPGLAALARTILEEIRDVAVAEAVGLDAGMDERLFGGGDKQGSGNLQSRTSMWSDYVRNRPTEIEFLNGAVVRRGKRHGIPTPVNEAIVLLVRALESAPRKV